MQLGRFVQGAASRGVLADLANFSGYGRPQMTQAISLFVEAIGSPLLVSLRFIPGVVPNASSFTNQHALRSKKTYKL